MFATDHVPLASYLTTMGHRCSAVRNPNSKRVMFNFEDDAKHDVEVFLNGRGLVEPASYERKRLKLLKKIQRLIRDRKEEVEDAT